MKRKLVVTIMAVMISIGLLACGSKDLAQTDTAEVTEEQTSLEKETVEEEESAETGEESEQEADAEVEEVPEEEESVLKWYMDEEGLKSKELGLIIRNNTVMEEIGFLVNYGICAKGASGNSGTFSQQVFNCNYYEGDLDSYISENEKMEKGTIGDISYAYRDSEDYGIPEIAFVGNGVIIHSYLNVEENLVDYIEKINLVKPYDEAPVDCLAYITDNGLYCPALGIELTCEEEGHLVNVINSIGVGCTWPNYGASMRIMDESVGEGSMYYMMDSQNAQEVVDKYVEGKIEPNEYKTTEDSAIDGTVEVNLGVNKFLGRGVVWKYSWDSDNNEYEDWLFYSNGATWSVNVSYDAGNNYEDYLSFIEELQ